MEIKGFIPNTMLDWEGVVASTLFTPGCNFRCPYCQNPDLVLRPGKVETVPLERILGFIKEREGWIDGVCITGGEPCMHQDLPDLCSELQSAGLGVKLDTNGSYPERLKMMIEDKLVDYVAMDVKAPMEPSAYKMSSGYQKDDLLEKIEASIALIRESGLEHEFRTTAVPMIHGPSEIERIAEYLEGEESYIIQYFRPGETIDPRFADLKPFTEDDMKTMLKAARKHIPGTRVRGAPAALE